MSTPALRAVIDGIPVPVAAQSWETQRVEARVLAEMADKGTREFLAWQPPELPLAAHRWRFVLDWTHADKSKEIIEQIFAVPGVHTLVLWRPEVHAWRGDGARRAYRLPRPLALDAVAPPGGAPAHPYQPRFHFGVGGPSGVGVVDLAVVVKTAADYGAGEPPAGEVWRVEGGVDFKLGAPPEAGAVLRAQVVPVYRVLRAPESRQRLTGPFREPLSLVLWEV
ncbi:MAG: hypothetical protein AAGN66_08590 [Acidobacteriota bacterium]